MQALPPQFPADVRDILALAVFSAPVDNGAEQGIEQEIAVQDGRGISAECQMTGQAADRCRGGGLPAVIGLGGAAGDQDIRPAGQGLAQEVFQLPGLVAAEGKAALVVALHQDPRSPEMP